MGDLEYLISIIARLRDEASPKIAALKAEIDKLKSSQDADRATQDLSHSIEDLGDKSDKTKKSQEDLRSEHERSRRATEDASRGAKNLADDVDKTGRIHDRTAESVSGHTKIQQDFADALAKVRKESQDTGDGVESLETRVSKLDNSWRNLESTLKGGELSKGEAALKLRQYSSEMKSLSKEAEVGSDSLKTLVGDIGRIDQYLKKTDFGASGSFLNALQSRNLDTVFGTLDKKIGDLGIRITGVASFFQGFFDLVKIGFSQQLITGVISLAGSLFSVASAATQAGAALAGAFVSGIGQAIPMLSIIAAAVERFKTILQAVSVAGQAEQQKFFNPTEKQVTQLQNINQLISSQQQLSNSYIQLYEAQQRVRDSQIALNEARYEALRNITELSLAEKDARLQAEGADLSLAESRRQLQIDIQKGNIANLASAELAVKQAELSQKKAEFEIPKAEREARLARQRGVGGSPAVISATEGLEGARLSVIQARQGAEAAQRQEQITRLQQASRSSRETQYESQLKFLEKGMSSTELGLTNALIGIERELKSPDSPLKKITNYFVEPFTDAIEKIRSLLHTSSFLDPINELAKSMGDGLRRLGNVVFGERGTGFFETMARDASTNIPIVSEAIEKLMKLFEDIAKAADPVFQKLSEDWDKFWSKLDTKYSSFEGLIKLKDFFDKSIIYAEDFARLGSALFDLFKAIGSDAAPQGLKIVSSFTESIKDATSWIDSHKSSVTNFFSEARKGLGLIGSTLFEIGKQMVEVFNLDSLRALSSFLNEVLIPGLRLVVNIIGKVTTVILDFFNILGKPGRDLLGIFGALIVTIIGITKIYEPVKTAITLFRGLKSAILALRAGEGIIGAWNALAGAFEKTGKAAADARVEVEGLAAGEAGAGAAGTDAAAQEGLAAGEAGAGAAGSAGILGAGGALGPLALVGGGYLIARSATAGLGQSSFQGIPTTGSFLDEAGRDLHRAIASPSIGSTLLDVGTMNFGGAISNILGSTGENSSESRIRRFGDKVEELKGKLNTLPRSKLEEVQREAESLAQNSALGKFKETLEHTAKAFSPSEVAAKKWSESIIEYFNKLSPAAKNVAETFQTINTTSGSIWKNIQNIVKENTENIKENLGLKSRQGKEALEANFTEATIKVEESMKKGGMSVKIGMERIRDLVSEQLKIFGAHPAELQHAGHAASGIGNQISKGLSGFAAGEYIPAKPGGQIARVGEAGHDEVVLSTDPRHANRSRQLLGQYFSRAPHMAEGGPVGYESPFHGAIRWGRSDQGTDVNLTPGSPITAIGDARIKGIISNWFQGQPFIWYELLNGLDKGKDVYVAEQINRLAQVGKEVKAGQPIAYYAPSGTGIETGWATASGQTLAAVTSGYKEGQATPAGMAFTTFLHGLATGKIVAGEAIQNILAPKIKGGGMIGQIAQGALNKVAGAANQYLEKILSSTAASKITEAAGSIGTAWSGTWVHVMEQIAKAKNWSLAAWRAVINRESGGNPNALGSPTIAGSNAKGLSRAYGLGQFLGSTYTEYSKYGADSSDPVKQIEAMAQYIANDYGNPTNALHSEETRGYYALGGIIGDHVRRLGMRNVRKKLLKFAAGGIAPWGGRPVPIIAHENERILNPAQWHETARLAGTSPGGLDHHLGFDGSPRQSFASGGKVPKPEVEKSWAQPITEGAFQSPVSGELEIGTLDSILKIFKLIREGFKKLGKTSKKTFLDQLSTYIQEIVIAESGTLARLQEGREFLKAKLTRGAVEREYTKAGGKIQLGPRGEIGIAQENEKVLAEESKILQDERRNLTQIEKETKKLKPSTTRTTALHTLALKQRELGEAIDQNIEARYQAETQVLQDQINQMNSQYQVQSQKLSTQLSVAQSLGNLNQVSPIEENIKQAAEAQYHRLGSALIGAQSIGDTELANQIKQEMASLEQTIFSVTAEKISNVQNLIQREFGLRESYAQVNLSKSKIAAQLGNFAEAGALEQSGLQERGRNLLSTRAEEEQLKAQAAQEGDTAAVITLTEELNKNTTEIAENNLALKESAVINRELVLNQIQNETGVRTGVENALKTGIETFGKITGFVNVPALKSVVESEKGTLLGAQNKYEQSGTELGFQTIGMTAKQVLEYLASPQAQSIITRIETSGTAGEKQSLEKFLTNIEGNSVALLKNSEELAKLNGQLNQPQSFSTSAFNSFRDSFFTGMGNLLPTYSAALPPGFRPEGLPVYGSGTPGMPTNSGTNIGQINLTHPVERLDPALFGEELSYHIATTQPTS